MAATQSLSRSSFAIPRVSKSQITQLPSEHPAGRRVLWVFHEISKRVESMQEMGM